MPQSKAQYPAAHGSVSGSGFKLGSRAQGLEPDNAADRVKRPPDNERPLLLSAQAITHLSAYHQIHLTIVV
jgi:hypothetical protein